MIQLIKTEKEYDKALKQLEAVFDAKPGTAEADKAEVLAVLIDHYEQKHYPIEAPDPIEAIKIRMEELGLKQKDLTPIIGMKSKVSEVLNKKRKLNLDMIRKLSAFLKISIEILVTDYKLAR